MPVPARPRRLPLAGLVAAVALAGLAAWWWFGRDATGDAGGWRTATVERGDVRVVISATGTLRATTTVDVGSQVSGQVLDVLVDFNDRVTKGQPIATLDPAPLATRLRQAQADLANADLKRAEELIDRKTISEAIFEQRVQAKRAADAQVQSAEANVRMAALNLEFTELRSPVDGRIGDRRVSPGNLVIGGSQPSTTLLATVVSTDPIRFEFTFDEQAFLRYSRLADDGTSIDKRGVEVELRLLDEASFGHKGKLDFIDNVINETSGTIRGRAVFANPDGLFTPGMFARVRVPASRPFEALLVPDSAIGTEQIRKFVYVVDGENTVRQKYVTLGPLDNGMRVVQKGIEATDRVIVNGMVRARPGIKVTPQTEGEKPATPPAAK